MKPLALKDIISLDAYERQRQEMRRRIIALKAIRRVRIGPRVSIVFENRDTMRFQVQEMCRIEHIEDPDLVQQEIECYNDLLPEGLAVGATLLIELVQEDDMPVLLKELSGIEEAVWMSFNGYQIKAEAEAGRSTEEKTSSVHYLTWRFDAGSRDALAKFPKVALEIRHPHYAHELTLDKKTVASLVQDLIDH